MTSITNTRSTAIPAVNSGMPTGLAAALRTGTPGVLVSCPVTGGRYRPVLTIVPMFFPASVMLSPLRPAVLWKEPSLDLLSCRSSASSKICPPIRLATSRTLSPEPSVNDSGGPRSKSGDDRLTTTPPSPGENFPSVSPRRSPPESAFSRHRDWRGPG